MRRFAAAVAVAAILATDASAETNNDRERGKPMRARQSTFEEGLRLRAPASIAIEISGGSAQQCMGRCIANARCDFWVSVHETCMLYSGEATDADWRQEFYTSGKIRPR